MALEIRQSLKLAQQPIMTPQLQQAIKLLQLSRMELVDLIRQEQEENPILEETLEPSGEAEPLESTYETLSPSTAEKKEKTEGEFEIPGLDWRSEGSSAMAAAAQSLGGRGRGDWGIHHRQPQRGWNASNDDRRNRVPERI